MKSIYVVTHPQATHHVQGLVGGWFDSELTELGLRQAEAIAAQLAARLGDSLVQTVSSDLRRARHAAEIILDRLGGELRLDPDLRERSCGVAGGRPTAWLTARAIPLPEQGDRLRHDDGIDGSETRMDLAVRAYAAMAQLQPSPVENHVVVTHGGTATLLLAAWIGMPLESAGLVQFGLTSGGITHLRTNPRNHSHEIVRLNDTEHLRLTEGTTSSG